MASRKPFDPSRVHDPVDAAPAEGDGMLTVTQVTALVKRTIERAIPATIQVLGEISNLKRHSSGHLYFTLKDANSELSCVMWRSAAAKMKFDPQDGLSVIASGKVEVFERAGRYQLYVRKIEPRGVGPLELAFRQLHDKLAAEGLFRPELKKPIPPFPSRVAVVTSPTGAAIADIQRTMERRFPCTEILVCPVRVQGKGAAEEIATAIGKVNRRADSLGGVDVMIVGRGGGSLEDLWAFNEEVVARAIHASRIPVVSAVGHEVDVSIADLVADVRAATPTAAAELVVPVLDEVLGLIESQARRMSRAVAHVKELSTSRLANVERDSWYREPMGVIDRRLELLDDICIRTEQTQMKRFRVVRERLDRCRILVDRISPHDHLRKTAMRAEEGWHRLHLAMRTLMANTEQRLQRHENELALMGPARFLFAYRDRISNADRRLIAAMGYRVQRLAGEVRHREEKLCAMGYKSVLGRGFSITRTKKGNKIVRTPAGLVDYQRLVTETADGVFESEVVGLRQMELFDNNG